jgi:hypothetical protein
MDHTEIHEWLDGVDAVYLSLNQHPYEHIDLLYGVLQAYVWPYYTEYLS